MDDIKPPRRQPRPLAQTGLSHHPIRKNPHPTKPSASIPTPAAPSPGDTPHSTFKTPEAAAAEDELRQKLDMPEGATRQAPKKRRFQLKFRKPTKRQLLIIIPVVAILLGGGGAAAYLLVFKEKPAPPKPVVVKKEEPPKEPPKPTTVASPLTGVQIAPELAELPVTGVMIENSPDARPQSGLKDAGIVYEAVAEGGITRFLALFQESQPDHIGPIRSARPYYVEWAHSYDAGYAHVGGSPDALDLIRSAGVKDLDQFYNPGPYERVTTRYAPHNVYSSTAKLLELQKSKGYTKSTFTGFVRKAEKPVTPPTATSIDLTISSYLYNPHFDYNAATNSYLRSQAGRPHVDERSGQQISSKVVLVIVVPFSIHPNGVNSVYNTTGSGKAFVFQDGQVTEGTWTKGGSKQHIVLTDTTGTPLPINPGQTWISVVKTEGSVAYK